MIHLKQFFVQRERERVRVHGTWKIVCRAVKDLTFPVQFIKMDAIWGPPPSIHQARRSIFDPLFTQYFNFASIPSWHGVQSSRVKYCRTTYKVWCYGILDCLLSMSEPLLLYWHYYAVCTMCMKCVRTGKRVAALQKSNQMLKCSMAYYCFPFPPQKCPLASFSLWSSKDALWRWLFLCYYSYCSVLFLLLSFCCRGCRGWGWWMACTDWPELTG